MKNIHKETSAVQTLLDDSSTIVQWFCAIKLIHAAQDKLKSFRQI